MTDKVNKEESIARVYQFLNKQKDWKTLADKNGNGTIVKTEFRTYLLGSGFKFNNGENKEDLIDAFWKSIDTNTTGKMGGGSKTSNKCALDANELANAEKTIEATKKIISFIQTKEAPQDVRNAGKESDWKKSVKEGLIFRASEYIKTGGEVTEEWLNEAYKLSSVKATADYLAKSLLESENRDVEGYRPGSDETFNAITDEYVAQLEENPKDEATVINEIKNIVSAYIDTANTNSKTSTDLLAQYGYDPYGSLNELQVTTLVNDITDKVLDYLKNNYKDIYSDDYEAQAKALVKEYLEEYLSGRTADEFNKLKSMDISVVTGTSEFETLISELKDAQSQIQNARKELDKYVAEVLAKNDAEKTAVVKEVIGTTNATEVMNKLLELKTLDEITAKHNELKTRIEEIDNRLDGNFFSALSDTTISLGESKNINLPNSTAKYSTNELSYKVENGNSNISVNENGLVTIQGNQVGTFKNITISVYANGTLLGTSQPITITVKESSQSIVDRIVDWNGETAQNIEAVSVTGNDSCTINKRLTDKSFKDLYNNDDIVRLHLSMDDSESWESAGKIINSRLDQLGNLIFEGLSTAGISSDILRKAVDNVIKTYKDGKFANGSLNDDDDGTDGYDLTNNLVWRMRNDRTGTGHKVVGTRDDDGSDSWVWGVRFKDIVDDIIAEYHKLGG